MNFDLIHLTGSEGFVGRELKTKLTSNALKYLSYDFKSNSPEVMHPEKIFSELEKHKDKKQVIIHLGAEASTSKSKISQIRTRNLEYTSHLSSLSSAIQVPIIFASSAAVYGTDMRRGLNPSPHNFYGLSKLLSEQELFRDYGDQLNNLLVCRFFNVYGEGEESKGDMMSVPSRFILDSLASKCVSIWTNSSLEAPSRDFIFVRDLVSALVELLASHPWSHSLVDLGTGVSVTFSQVAEMINSMTKIKVIFRDLPVEIDPAGYQVYTKANNNHLLRIIPNFAFSRLEMNLPGLWSYYLGTGYDRI